MGQRQTKESITMDLVYIASANLFTDKTLRFFLQTFVGAADTEGAKRGCIFGIFDPLHYQNVTERKFLFFATNFLKVSDDYSLELSLYLNFFEFVESFNMHF